MAFEDCSSLNVAIVYIGSFNELYCREYESIKKNEHSFMLENAELVDLSNQVNFEVFKQKVLSNHYNFFAVVGGESRSPLLDWLSRSGVIIYSASTEDKNVPFLKLLRREDRKSRSWMYYSYRTNYLGAYQLILV